MDDSKFFTAPRAAVGAVVIKEAKVLLVKRKYPPQKGKWAVPGGLVELGETLQEAAQREIEEETGLIIQAKEPVHTFDLIERDSKGDIVFHYVIVDLEADYVSGRIIPADDASDAGWFGSEEMNDLGIFPVILIAMGILFNRLSQTPGLIPGETELGLHIASWVLFATAPFILFIYWLVLPTKIFIHSDRIRVQYGRFFWNVRFDTIESLKAAKGIPPAWSNSSVTSYRNQIEIVRKGKMNIRLSPDNRDRFLDHANRALSDWKRMQGR
jgi:8-oxo-dGTP diphosphatase